MIAPEPLKQKWRSRQSFAGLQSEGVINVNCKVVCIDSTTVKVHPDACGALKKVENKQSTGQEADELRKSIQSLHGAVLNFSLSSGSANDSPMRLPYFTPYGKQKQYLLMDRAYSGEKMTETAPRLGYAPVVPSKRHL